MLTVSVSAENLLARLAGTEPRLRSNLRSAVERLSVQVQELVKAKLTGPVLSTRTGTLRRSINRLVTEDASSISASVGTNVRYAAVHEYGFQGSVSVKAHVRTSVLGKEYQVPSFTRSMNLPERSFLRSSVKDMEGQIVKTLRQAALDAVKP